MNLWACEENFLRSYLERIYNTTADQEKIEAFFLLTSEDEQDDPIYSIDGDRATINIKGILTQNGLPPIAKFFGFEGTSYIEIIEAIEAVNLESIKSIDLVMDTPGGEVAGVDETAQAVKALAQLKSVTAINEGMIASAGYWIASQAGQITALAPTAETGSIGVVIAGVDTTEAEKARGIKRVTIVSKNAPNKRADVTDKKGIVELQRRIDAIERIFISRVASGRGVSEQTVKDSFGQGGLLIAFDPDETKASAISSGMIDSIEGFILGTEGTIENIRAIEAEEIAPVENIEVKEDEQNEKELGQMSIEKLLAENPDLASHIEAEKEKAFTSGKTEIADKSKSAIAILEGDKYPAAIRSIACAVLKGEQDPAALIGAVAAFDAIKEAEAGKAAVAEQPLDTPAQVAETPSSDGVLRNQEDFDNSIKRIRAARGLTN